MRNTLRTSFVFCCALGALVACGEDDPVAQGLDTGSPDAGDTGTSDTSSDVGGTPTECEQACAEIGACDVDDACGDVLATCLAVCADDASAIEALAGTACDTAATLLAEDFGGDIACAQGGCEPDPTDYSPGADDSWDACVSDGGEYVQVEENVSTIARVGGYEDIADILWRIDGAPSPDAFVDAREIYAVDEGLNSRIVRREDEHYPPVTDGDGNILQCRDEGVPAMDPDRCVGPAGILPILNVAFQQGAAGNQPLVQAARIDAALLWFLYVSTYKENTTCADVKKDCDSGWAYYTGGNQRDGGLGLSGVFRATDGTSHDRVFDGILAVRCWRDLDPEETATDLETQARALAQLDRALLQGLSRIVADRIARMAGETGEAREASWAWIQILGNVLMRETTARNPQAGAELTTLLQATADAADVGAIQDVLVGTFPCP